MSENELVALRGQVEALEGWRAQMLAVQEAADAKLRPLLEYVPGALGRNVYEVAAEEIVRLRAVEAAARDLLHEIDHGPTDLRMERLTEMENVLRPLVSG